MNKFNDLKKFSKNEICEFLEFKDIMDKIRFLNKKTFIFFKDPNIKNIITYMIINITKFIDKINFEQASLSPIKKELS